ncbi:MAG: hypothetical protein JNN06_16100 [Gemmobacter sp.]|uniref:hypothetical protein n=1 Tax=Gemmobacter sp. TaxID=1898957 RepID=UPI001A44EAD6|nr:hypothetical protein [Gemmobacter sp.]MBL8563793.1 hypothetical protein [Gemmobacter sp.]
MRTITLPKTALAALATLALLGACKDEEAKCTQEQAEAKMTAFAQEMQKVAASNPAKLAELAPKAAEIQQQLTANPDDTAAACKALDDLTAMLK